MKQHDHRRRSDNNRFDHERLRFAIRASGLYTASFARRIGLPDSEALYDVLTSLPPCRITLAGTSCLYPLLGAYAEKLLAVFRDAARDNENIQFQEESEIF